MQLVDRGVAFDPVRLLADHNYVVVRVATIRIDSVDRRRVVARLTVADEDRDAKDGTRFRDDDVGRVQCAYDIRELAPTPDVVEQLDRPAVDVVA